MVNEELMKSKQLKITVIVALATYLLAICIYCLHQGTKSHIDARQAEYYVHQLTDNRRDSVRNDILINKRAAIKMADLFFSGKYGKWHTILWKPFDVYLIKDYWLVYGPGSNSNPESGPVIVINCNTGETRFLPDNKVRKLSFL